MFVSRAGLMLTLSPCLRSRRSRYIFFLLCSPLLLPLLCAFFPIFCASEIFFRLRLRRRRIRKSSSSAIAVAIPSEEDDALLLRRCEEGCGCGAVGAGEEEEEEREACLLQRYLEDQLILVRSVYDCGEYDGNDDSDVDRSNLDPNLDRATVRLLS